MVAAEQPDGVGVRILAARKAKDMSQQALAAKLDVKQATVSRWEKGGAFSNVPTLRKIADALEITVCDLLDEDCAS